MTRLQEAPPPSGDMDSCATPTRATEVGLAQNERLGADARVALPTAPSTFQAAFLPAPERVSDIRQSTAAFLRQSGVPESTADDVVLVVSELVTNAVIHGRGEISFRASAADGRIGVVVVTNSSGRAVVRDAGLDDESGRGMFLVDVLANSWGVSAGMTWCVFRYEPDKTRTVAA